MNILAEIVANMNQAKFLLLKAFENCPPLLSSRLISSNKLIFSEFGDPVKVIHVVEEDVSNVQSTEVGMQFQ